MTSSSVSAPITEEHCEVLGELFNIAIGRASSSLAQVLDVFIEMSVPRVRIAETAEVRGMLREADGPGSLAVEQSFSGHICGQTLLFFDLAGVEVLRDLMLAPSEIVDLGPENASKEVLHEIGNIVMTTSTGVFAAQLGGETAFCPPQVLRRDEVPQRFGAQLEEVFALVVDTEVATASAEFRGKYIMLQKPETTQWLVRALDEFLEGLAA